MTYSGYAVEGAPLLATGRVKRRLAAIVAVDVAGYSRRMGPDEKATHLRLKAHFGQLVYSKLNSHGGQIVKITGDTGGISECSRRGAVCCRIQLGMIPNNFELHSDPLDFWPLALRAEVTHEKR